MSSVYTGAMISTHSHHDTNERIHVSNKPQHIASKTQGKPIHKADHSQVVVNAYREAFGKHYPAHSLEFKPAKEGKTWVIIGGDKGERPLSADELAEATRDFLR